MLSGFKEWLNEEHNPNEKPIWSGKKEEILSYWKATPPNQPIYMLPLSRDHKGKSFGEDNIRIGGSKQFIISVLSHLKDLLKYEGKGTKLNLVYRGSKYDKSRQPDGVSYIFYALAQQRKINKNNNAKIVI